MEESNREAEQERLITPAERERAYKEEHAKREEVLKKYGKALEQEQERRGKAHEPPSFWRPV